MNYRKNSAPSPTGAPTMTPEDRKHLRELQIKEFFEDDIPSSCTRGAQWMEDEIEKADRRRAEQAYIAHQARKDGGGAWKHPPRAKPGRIRAWIENAIGLACIIVMVLVFYVVMP